MSEIEHTKGAIEPKYTEQQIPDVKAIDLFDVEGTILTVTATPTYVARRFSEQFKIKSNGTLCFYDVDNATWTCVGADPTNSGVVTATNIAGTPFPTGWSVNHTGTGFYVITHNLEHTNYTVFVQLTSIFGFVDTQSIGNNSFTVHIKDTGGTDADSGFHFIVKDET